MGGAAGRTYTKQSHHKTCSLTHPPSVGERLGSLCTLLLPFFCFFACPSVPPTGPPHSHLCLTIALEGVWFISCLLHLAFISFIPMPTRSAPADKDSLRWGYAASGGDSRASRITLHLISFPRRVCTCRGSVWELLGMFKRGWGCK